MSIGIDWIGYYGKTHKNWCKCWKMRKKICSIRSIWFFLTPVFWIESIIKMCKIFLIRYSAWYRSMPNTRVILKKNLFLNIRYIYSHPCMHRVLEKMEKTKKDENCDNTDCDNATVRGWVDDDMHTHAHLTSEYAQNIMP